MNGKETVLAEYIQAELIADNLKKQSKEIVNFFVCVYGA